MRRGDRRGRIGRELRPELRMGEGGAEVGGRLPDRVIQISRAVADRAVKLGGDEARLALHEGGVVLPDFEKARLVGCIQREYVHQHDGARIDADLAIDRKGRIKRAKQGHDNAPDIWFHSTNVVPRHYMTLDIMMSI